MAHVASPPVDASAALYKRWPQTSIEGSISMEYGSYPERPGEPDCAYYLRTGLCRFGMTCRYNHPSDRALAIAAARRKGEYPERIGQPDCQYYLKTGTCKFGPMCKFNHPRDQGAITAMVELNFLGYPLRPDEKECAYYMRTGECKYGNICKFHHPQPSSTEASLLSSSVYLPVNSSTSPGPYSYTGNLTSWPLSRASFFASPRWQGPSSYTQLILPQGLVHVPNWNAYAGHLSSASSPGSRQQSAGSFEAYGTSHQAGAGAGAEGIEASYHHRAGAVPAAHYSLRRESTLFPERPGQPACQFYMKTGDCKFGAMCKFHHPRDRQAPAPNCALSPLGFPLRPGEPYCNFYSRYGICKFGSSCKFDHPMVTPMGVYAYPMSGGANISAVHRQSGSSSELALTHSAT